MTVPPIVTAFDVKRINNAQLMRDVATLGYLKFEDYTLDCTYGTGRFWKLWRPLALIPTDLTMGIDFQYLPFPDGEFDATVIDGPYKLNGTSTSKGASALDAGYGVTAPAKWQERHALINAGIRECVRVTQRGGKVFVKCQDQVCLSKVRWQTREFSDTAEKAGCRLVDQIHVYGSRKQPRDGTDRQSQDHARHNYSTLLVLQRER